MSYFPNVLYCLHAELMHLDIVFNAYQYIDTCIKYKYSFSETHQISKLLDLDFRHAFYQQGSKIFLIKLDDVNYSIVDTRGDKHLDLIDLINSVIVPFDLCLVSADNLNHTDSIYRLKYLVFSYLSFKSNLVRVNGFILNESGIVNQQDHLIDILTYFKYGILADRQLADQKF